jgi:hypothetical protein
MAMHICLFALNGHAHLQGLDNDFNSKIPDVEDVEAGRPSISVLQDRTLSCGGSVRNDVDKIQWH